MNAAVAERLGTSQRMAFHVVQFEEVRGGSAPVRSLHLASVQPLPQEASSWRRAFLISAALHVVIAGAVFVDWDWRKSEPAAPPAAMMVELAVMPSSPPVPPSEVPPGPEQVEAAPKPKALEMPKFDPPPRADSALKPEFAVPLKQESQPTDAKLVAAEARQTTAPPSIEAPKDEINKAPVEGANSAAPSDAEQAWEGRILAKLERNKRYPAEAQSSGQEDVVLVRMVLDRHGRLLSSAVAKSRGLFLLDREVLQLTQRSSPFPPPPDSVAGEQIHLVVPVEFFLKKR
jgi:protein TonB